MKARSATTIHELAGRWVYCAFCRLSPTGEGDELAVRYCRNCGKPACFWCLWINKHKCEV